MRLAYVINLASYMVSQPEGAISDANLPIQELIGLIIKKNTNGNAELYQTEIDVLLIGLSDIKTIRKELETLELDLINYLDGKANEIIPNTTIRDWSFQKWISNYDIQISPK